MFPDNNMERIASVGPTVTGKLPTEPITKISSWEFIKGLPLPDPDFKIPGRIDLLLGCDVVDDIYLQSEVKKKPLDTQQLLTPFLDWVIQG